jgi:hypothetical protein
VCTYFAEERDDLAPAVPLRRAFFEPTASPAVRLFPAFFSGLVRFVLRPEEVIPVAASPLTLLEALASVFGAAAVAGVPPASESKKDAASKSPGCAGVGMGKRWFEVEVFSAVIGPCL